MQCEQTCYQGGVWEPRDDAAHSMTFAGDIPEGSFARLMKANFNRLIDGDGVRDVVGPDAMLTGFYSYGEISPFTPGDRCELHDRTMTITTFGER